MDVLTRLLAQLREFWGGLGGARRFALIAAAVGVFGSLLAVAFLTPGQSWRPLYTDLAPEEAGAMKSKLTAQNIPNRLSSGGTSVEVPEERYAEARVTLASEGLPTRGGKGYELFDEASLTMTPFVQGVNYQRALQAELARSIMQLEPVQSARVLIAKSEPTPFVRDQRPPTASVVLKLKPGAAMSRATSAGIVSLVARSVEGLKPENVTVVDSGGRLLSDPNAGERDSLPAPQLEYRRELETYLSTKAEQMLAQHLGPGRAVVRVSADVDFRQVKERRETYFPEEKVVVAERVSSSKNSGSGAKGVAGASSNVVRAGGTASSGGGGSSSQDETTQTDYVVSKSVRDLEDRMGSVSRLTIAAMVDLSGEGQNLINENDAREIIKQAVGFRTGRDEVKLSNVKLTGPIGPPEPDDTLNKLQRIQAYVGLARNLCLALAVFFAVAIVPLLALRRRRVVEVPAATPPETADVEVKRGANLARLVELAKTEPDRVAEILKIMLGAPAARP